MRDTRKIARPRLLVPLGFGSATLGAVVLSLSTFQTQTQGPSGSSLGSGSVTFTFTWQPLFPVTAALLVLIMAIPAWSGTFVGRTISAASSHPRSWPWEWCGRSIGRCSRRPWGP